MPAETGWACWGEVRGETGSSPRSSGCSFQDTGRRKTGERHPSPHHIDAGIIFTYRHRVRGIISRGGAEFASISPVRAPRRFCVNKIPQIQLPKKADCWRRRKQQELRADVPRIKSGGKCREHARKHRPVCARVGAFCEDSAGSGTQLLGELGEKGRCVCAQGSRCSQIFKIR